METILIQGARTHNLKNLELELPRHQLIVITGVSGSGKSSLAFDTLYAEGQRRYVESLSAYARQFLSLMEKPDVDRIEGLSPAISIEQKSTSHNPRSTVGTVTEIHDYLRLLFARVGTPRCPTHGVALEIQTISEMVDKVLSLPEESRLILLAPIIQGRKGEHRHILEGLRGQGFIRARIDGQLIELDDPPGLDPKRKHTIEAVIDRFKVRPDLTQRLAESFETALKLAEGLALIAFDDSQQDPLLFSTRHACPHCDYSFPVLEPRIFSFNNPAGACPQCDGLGFRTYFDPKRLVNPELTLMEGAVRGYESRRSYHDRILVPLAKHYQFKLTAPFHSFSQEIQDKILYGSGEEKILFPGFDTEGTPQKRTFEGLIPALERRYRETESDAVREELKEYLSLRLCESCQGSRLNLAARHVFVAGEALPNISDLAVRDSLKFFETLKLPGQRGEIAHKIIQEIQARLGFLVDVGLDYLTLSRSAETLSGGEAQRIRLASQIGSGLTGVMYVLDEPSIGLHQRDNQRLLKTLTRLRDLGNTVIVVEHDEEAIDSADFVVDMGPGAGVHGGEVVAKGTPKQIAQAKESLTGQYLSGKRKINLPASRVAPQEGKWLSVLGATGNNLKSVDANIPLGLLTCVTGVSGSGKSTLINDTLYSHAAASIHHSQRESSPCQAIEGLDQIDKVIDIDQSPIGRTPRSNPATYIGVFTLIRELFAATPEARARGYAVGRFSFNVKGGRCEACQGDGVIRVEMHFLPDIYVTCDRCKGERYNRETLEIRYKGKNIYEILSMTAEDALEFFQAVPAIARKLTTLVEVGLGYLQLGQNATTLSGGEAQRVKLAKELSRRDTGKTLYILDEPTTGLHFHDIDQLLKILHRLRDHGNTVVVIEHNLDVIKTADWIIDLGPEGGEGGGKIIATGTPETIAQQAISHTGQFLKGKLIPSPQPPKRVRKKAGKE